MRPNVNKQDYFFMGNFIFLYRENNAAIIATGACI